VEEEVVHLMVYRKKRERKRIGPVITFKSRPPMTFFLQLDTSF
jgi:hypothetical protein